MKAILVFVVILSMSCQSPQVTNTKNKGTEFEEKVDSLRTTNQSVNAISGSDNLSFIDSIAKKLALSIDQIKYHTTIDSIYYTGMLSGVNFNGDTVLNFSNGFKGAVLIYDDKKSCIYKFLIVLDATGNFSRTNKIIYSDCDRDESANYLTPTYRFLNDSVFETIETYYSANTTNQSIEKIKWKISNNGTIDSLGSGVGR